MSIDKLFFSEAEPGIIKENSESIKRILGAEELDSELLLERVEDREKLILQFLDEQPDSDKLLIQDLIRTNKELTELVSVLKSEQQKVLVSFLRTRKAVKKYQ